MNRAVVIRAAAGLTAYLRTLDPEPFVVVGYDARTMEARVKRWLQETTGARKAR